MVKILIQAGACVQKRAHIYGKRIVHYACEHGHCEIMTMLTEKNVDIEVVDDQGRTPLHVNHAPLIRLLCSLGANKEKRDNKGDTPLKLAIARTGFGAIEALLYAGFDIQEVLEYFSQEPVMNSEMALIHVRLLAFRRNYELCQFLKILMLEPSSRLCKDYFCRDITLYVLSNFLRYAAPYLDKKESKYHRSVLKH